MSRITEILQKRDGYSEKEAAEIEQEARDYLYEHAQSLEDMEDYLLSEGLEPDYIEDLFL